MATKDGLNTFGCPVCDRFFDSRRGVNAHLRQSDCGANIAVETAKAGPAYIPVFPPPPTGSLSSCASLRSPTPTTMRNSSVPTPTAMHTPLVPTPSMTRTAERRGVSFLSSNPFAASPEPVPPDYVEAKDRNNLSLLWSSHSSFCPLLSNVPVSCRRRYPVLWFAKNPRPACDRGRICGGCSCSSYFRLRLG